MQREVHLWCKCHLCGMNPISGACFRCETCPAGPETDLCGACYEQYRAGCRPHPTPENLLRTDGLPPVHCFRELVGAPPGSFAPWLSIHCPQVEPPRVPRGFLVRPEFRAAHYSAFGSYGFVTLTQQEVLVLTALHVLDEFGKHEHIDATAANHSYSGTELPNAIRTVVLYDVLNTRWMLHDLGKAGPMLVLADARSGDDEPLAFRDIAAFRVTPRPGLTPRPLATDEPTVGDPVWLAAKMPDGSLTRRAVCVEVGPRTCIFRYDEDKSSSQPTSGAPILDRHGRVVGINSGKGRLDGQDFGHANPLHSIRAHLAGVAGRRTEN